MIIGMLKTWFNHAAVTFAWGLLGFIAGGSAWAIACALFYFGREVRQHEDHGTGGFLPWFDRIADAAIPALVALAFAVLMR